MRFVSLVATLGIATLSIASIVACGGAAAEEDPVGEPATADDEGEEIKAAVIDEGDNNKTIPIALGRSFTIALADNASTGFVWNVKSVDRTIGHPKVTQVAGDSNRPGSSGLKKFTWSTKSPLNLVGRHTIVLEHARPFGSSGSTLFTVTIDIKDTTSAASCGGFMGTNCGEGSYCDFSLKARCGIADQPGKCATRPRLCPAVMLPVCGCDGKTYNNSCIANRNGASVTKTGPCAN